MGNYFDKPQHWRTRAEMTRSIANGMQGEQANILKRIADDYERIARRLEMELKTARRRDLRPKPADVKNQIVELQRKWNR